MLICPECAEALKPVKYGPAAVWRCATCEGRAATLPIIRDALARERWKDLQRAVVTAARPSTRACPSCRKPMWETEAHGVTFETCRRCQLLWFDAGEVPEPEPRSSLSPEAAEAAARFEVASIARRGDLAQEAAEPLTGWRFLGRFGFPYEIEAPPTAIVPWATIGLAVAVIAIGLLTLGDASWIHRFGFLPSAPLRYGGATLVTSFFLHAGLLHLFGNAYFLAVFGDNVEEATGRARFLLMTLLGTVGGALAHALFDPRANVPLIGASAGISAILAYYALRFPHARIGWFAWNLSARTYVALWVGFQLLAALRQAAGLSNVSAFGHIGGAGVGVAFWALQRRMGPWSSTDVPPS